MASDSECSRPLLVCVHVACIEQWSQQVVAVEKSGLPDHVEFITDGLDVVAALESASNAFRFLM